MEIRYYYSLVRSVFGIRPLREWPVRFAVALPGGILLAALLLTAFGPPGAFGSMTFMRRNSATDALIDRAGVVVEHLKNVDAVYEAEVAPLAAVITQYRNDKRLARRIATSLVREGRRAGVRSDVLLAVLLVENPWIEPSARSPVGARGLMQVMPGHRGQWRACPTSLDDIESNICYGAQIYRQYLREEDGDVSRALLRYNGCVNGTNTPNCGSYPALVFARIQRANIKRPVQAQSD